MWLLKCFNPQICFQLRAGSPAQQAFEPDPCVCSTTHDLQAASPQGNLATLYTTKACWPQVAPKKRLISCCGVPPFAGRDGPIIGQKAGLHQSLDLGRAAGCCCLGEEGSLQCPTARPRHQLVPWAGPPQWLWRRRLAGCLIEQHCDGVGFLQSLHFWRKTCFAAFESWWDQTNHRHGEMLQVLGTSSPACAAMAWLFSCCSSWRGSSLPLAQSCWRLQATG